MATAQPAQGAEHPLRTPGATHGDTPAARPHRPVPGEAGAAGHGGLGAAASPPPCGAPGAAAAAAGSARPRSGMGSPRDGTAAAAAADGNNTAAILAEAEKTPLTVLGNTPQ